MAHLRQIGRPKCSRDGCGATATHQLIDTWNGVRGAYCTKHATHALKRQEESERQAFDQQAPKGGV